MAGTFSPSGCQSDFRNDEAALSPGRAGVAETPVWIAPRVLLVGVVQQLASTYIVVNRTCWTRLPPELVRGSVICWPGRIAVTVHRSSGAAPTLLRMTR